MSPNAYPTALAVIFVALGVPLALVLGVTAPGLWLVGFAWSIFALGVVSSDALVAAAPGALRVATVLPGSIAMGAQAVARLELTFDTSIKPRTAQVSLDADPRVRLDPFRSEVSLEDGKASVEFSVVPLRRGQAHFKQAWIRWLSPLGLVWRQRVETIGRTVPVLPNLRMVKEEALQIFRRDAPLGLHALFDSGDSTEFHALREFQSGMDHRRIDWKQSAKHSRLQAKEFQAEQNQHVVFVLDTGRLMSEPLEGQPRLDRALHAILLMAFAALRLGDRVGLFAFDEKPRLVSGTVSGAQSFPLLQKLAAGLDYSTAETNFTLGLTQLASELERRSMVVIFTDFVDNTSAELMLENVGRLIRQHLVLFVVFRDPELESLRRAEPRSTEDVSRAVIADALLREREIVIERLRRIGVDIVDAPAADIGMKLLTTYLQAKRLGRI